MRFSFFMWERHLAANTKSFGKIFEAECRAPILKKTRRRITNIFDSRCRRQDNQDHCIAPRRQDAKKINTGNLAALRAVDHSTLIGFGINRLSRVRSADFQAGRRNRSAKICVSLCVLASLQRQVFDFVF
jgi:hypothetical protein